MTDRLERHVHRSPRPLSQLDARFPVTYAETVPAGTGVLVDYFSALAARDPRALAACLHYPFATFEGITPVVVAEESQLLDDPPASMDLRPGAPSLQPGCYDLLDEFGVHLYGPTGIGCSMSYSRYDAQGHRVAVCDGIYGITNNDGRWGIEFLSTIFTPVEAVGERYADAEEAALSGHRFAMSAFAGFDQALLNSTQQYGVRAHLSLSNPRDNARNAREGNPMAGYQVEGVKSRLRISTLTPESVVDLDHNFPQFAEWAGGGVGEWSYTITWPQGRVLHATIDKTHNFFGYLRYTADHRLISETHFMNVITYLNGRWGTAGVVAVMMYHDRSNDVATD